MSFICSISGEAPALPVVSAKTGRVYELRLLQKHLSENRGLEPHTDHELSEDDIIRVSTDLPPASTKPRPPTLTSIPSLLSAFQNEWDALVLETFSLKQQYHQVRQELSQALYQNDAACRVIARLMKERDEARHALAALQLQYPDSSSSSSSSAPPVPPVPVPIASTSSSDERTMEVDDLDPADAYFARAAETAKTLSAGRVKREPPADLASPDAWRGASEVPAITSLHMTTKPGINTLDIDAAGTLLLTGGMDNHAQVYSRATDHVLGTLKGHTKRITAALFSSGIGAAKGIVTASADKSVRVWTAKPANAEADGDVRSMGWTKKAIIKHHKAEVVGLAMHPGSSSQYFVSAAVDGAWAVHLAESGAVVVSGSIDANISCIAYHPDGAFLGLGTTDGFAKIFDLKQQQVLATLDTESNGNNPITALQFSENGYYLATVTSDNVAIWDLRKQKKSHQWGPTDLTPDAGGAFVDVRFDRSGKYFAIAMPNAIHVFRVKGWVSLAVLPCDDSIQTLQWAGQLSTAIVAACLENSLHVYEASSSSSASSQ